MQQPMQEVKSPESRNATTIRMLLPLHLTCGLGLALAFWAALDFCSLLLIQNPSQTLFIAWAVHALVVIPVFSQFRLDPDKCSYVKAIVRGLMGLPAGALVNALGAIVLGAPVGIHTEYEWCGLVKLVSLAVIVADLYFLFAVTGTSKRQKQRTIPPPPPKKHDIRAHVCHAVIDAVCTCSFCIWLIMDRLASDIRPLKVKPIQPIDFIICLPAHGAIIGAWFGAWPMPLDWERPWQEWPICVTYGAILGYLIGVMASFGFVVYYHNRQNHSKRE
ncbi:hypothetical protein SASPL_121995 [Salvia splendens]|uniref:Phosphatidylinositol glycan, class F n=1 Tax=Salvia splendens TaxID=180675 RepID=A0A8X8XKR9_SALSN|nr:hypothetical protein SASPL_121995 [Salvia splendens]